MAERIRPNTPALTAWLRRYSRTGHHAFDRLWRTACWEAAAIECRAKGWKDAEAVARDMAKQCAAGHDWWDKGCPCERCEREREEERKREEARKRATVTA